MKTLQQLFDEILKQTDGNYQDALNLISEMEGDENTLDKLWTIFESKLGD